MLTLPPPPATHTYILPTHIWLIVRSHTEDDKISPKELIHAVFYKLFFKIFNQHLELLLFFEDYGWKRREALVALWVCLCFCAVWKPVCGKSGGRVPGSLQIVRAETWKQEWNYLTRWQSYSFPQIQAPCWDSWTSAPLFTVFQRLKRKSGTNLCLNGIIALHLRRNGQCRQKPETEIGRLKN